MRKAKGDNIVPAMKELTERRDAGEPVHVILEEVAEDYEIPPVSLQRRAELSWGVPLETDRERHAAHFEYVELKAQAVREAKLLAREIWELNRPFVLEHSWWIVDWPAEFARALKDGNLDHPEIEALARAAFMDEARRLGGLTET